MECLPRLGMVSYLNCLPFSHALAGGPIHPHARVMAYPPARLNRMLEEDKLDVTAVSSIEYAHLQDRCLILPGLSIACDGPVRSVILISKVPVESLSGRKVCLTDSSATSVALLKILLPGSFNVHPQWITCPPDLDRMLEVGEAALLIGDDALRALAGNSSLYIYDLGKLWKDFTGEKMVFALWVVRRHYADNRPGEVHRIWESLLAAKSYGLHQKEILEKKMMLHGLPSPVVEGYFDVIKYDLTPPYQRGLKLFYDYAYRAGLVAQPVSLNIWEEQPCWTAS
ncbi:MAG: menaquinone biosynthetic enzyme MqnA/MqnD family protein [Bacillota bacterium]